MTAARARKTKQAEVQALDLEIDDTKNYASGVEATLPPSIIEPKHTSPMTVAERTDQSTVMAVIANLTRDPNFDMARFKELMAMAKEERLEHAEREYNTAMAACQGALEPIRRDRLNPDTGRKYPTLDSINAALVPIYAAHGFAVSFGSGICEKPGYTMFMADVSHIGGFTKRHAVELPDDMTGKQGNVNKTKIHGFGSSLTYGRKYLEMLIFNLTFEDDDDGRAAGANDKKKIQTATIDDAEIDHITNLIEERGGSVEKFLLATKLPSLADIRKGVEYDDFCKLVLQRKKKAAPADDFPGDR